MPVMPCRHVTAGVTTRLQSPQQTRTSRRRAAKSSKTPPWTRTEQTPRRLPSAGSWRVGRRDRTLARRTPRSDAGASDAAIRSQFRYLAVWTPCPADLRYGSERVGRSVGASRAPSIADPERHTPHPPARDFHVVEVRVGQDALAELRLFQQPDVSRVQVRFDDRLIGVRPHGIRLRLHGTPEVRDVGIAVVHCLRLWRVRAGE